MATSDPAVTRLLELLPREGRLIFLAAGRAGATERLREALDGPVDWPLLTQLAEREGATVALARALERAGVPLPDGAEQLRRMARVSTFKQMYLEQRLGESTAALAAAGVPCILLKGAALGTSVYPSFLDRPMADLDLLIEPEDAHRAVEALLAAGWRWQGRKPRDGDFSHLHHLPALLDGRRMHVCLELHTALYPPGDPFALPTAAVTAAATPGRGLPAGIRIPSPEHLLLHACTHFAWSHLMRIHAWRAFRDVRAIMAAGALDWDELVRLAHATRAVTCCYWTLRLARDLAGVPVPTDRLAALRPPLPEAALRVVARHLALILLPAGGGCPSARLRRLGWSAGVMPRWSGHGAARPWELLALDGDTAARRGAAGSARERPPRTGAARGWWQYCRTVLAGPARPAA